MIIKAEKVSLVTWYFIQDTLNKMDDDLAELDRAIDEISEFDLPKKLLEAKRCELEKERTDVRSKCAPAMGVQ